MAGLPGTAATSSICGATSLNPKIASCRRHVYGAQTKSGLERKKRTKKSPAAARGVVLTEKPGRLDYFD
jgi:hypothetical protein